MAIALGVVLFLVLIGVLVAFARRRDDSDYPARAPDGEDTDPLTEKDNARRATLLATVGAAAVSSCAFF